MSKTTISTEKKQSSQTDDMKNIENSGVYSVTEFAETSRKLFGVPPEIVAAAFKKAKKSKATIDEAKRIINIFSKQEVK